MPGDEVADRAVRAHAQPGGGERVPEVVAEAAQDLELEVAGPPPSMRVARDRMRDRAQVVAGDRRRARAGAPRAGGPSAPRSCVAVGLALEHRRAPAVLARLDDLVVPVGALDQAHDERLVARRPPRPRRAPGRASPASRAGRPGARARRSGPSRTRPRRAARGPARHRLARVQRLHVDVQVRAELARVAQQLAQAGRGVALSALRRLGAQQRRERRHLHRQVRARDRPERVGLQRGVRVAARRRRRPARPARPRSARRSGRPRPR